MKKLCFVFGIFLFWGANSVCIGGGTGVKEKSYKKCKIGKQIQKKRYAKESFSTKVCDASIRFLVKVSAFFEGKKDFKLDEKALCCL